MPEVVKNVTFMALHFGNVNNSSGRKPRKLQALPSIRKLPEIIQMYQAVGSEEQWPVSASERKLENATLSTSVCPGYNGCGTMSYWLIELSSLMRSFSAFHKCKGGKVILGTLAATGNPKMPQI